MIILILIVIFISVFLFMRGLFFFLESYYAKKRLGVVCDKKIPGSYILNRTAPFWRSLSPRLQKLGFSRGRNFFGGLIEEAGLSGDLNVNDFWAFQIVSFFIFMPVGAIVRLSDSLSLSVAVWGAFGIVYPVVWLRGVIKDRKRRIIRELPNVIDIITLSVEAGLDFMDSIDRIVRGYSDSPLIEELKRMIEEVQLGASRADGIKNLAGRVKIPPLTSFSALLVQADRLGASIGPVLRAQSDKMRTDRFQRAEKAGVAAAQKILFPLVFFIIPAVFIIIFGPLVVQFVTKGFSGLF